MADPDFGDLRRELLDEFYYWIDRHGASNFAGMTPMYWGSRGPLWVAAAANLRGTKFMLSVDETTGLTELVRKALMFGDHVVIRHRTLLPPRGVVIGAVPADFAGFGPIAWIEQNRPTFLSSKVLPHNRGAPVLDKVRPFLDWVAGEGRPWVKSGLVTYAPNILPGEVMVALLKEEVNLSDLFRQADVVPQADRAINPKVASAVAQMSIPYLDSVTPELVQELKGEEEGAVRRFRQHVLNLVNAVSEEAGSPEFSRRIELLSGALSEETAALEASIGKHVSSATWRRVGVELLGLSAAVFFWMGVPQASIAALSAAAVAAAKEMKEGLDGRFSLKQHPLFALARLGQLRAKPQKWLPKVRKP